MNLDFEISRVDCISKENYYSHFNLKILHLSYLKHLPLPPLIQQKKKLSARSTPMHLDYVGKSIIFLSIQLIIHSLKHILPEDCFE